jgi:hypothetical protein
MCADFKFGAVLLGPVRQAHAILSALTEKLRRCVRNQQVNRSTFYLFIIGFRTPLACSLAAL